MGGGYVNKPNKTTKFETLNNKGIYKKLALLFVAVFLVASVYFKTSSARYKVTQEVQIVNGNIKANLDDLNAIAIYVDDVLQENNQIPNGNYEIDEENTKCTVNGDEVEGITFEYKDGKIGVYGISQGKTKCNFYLKKKKLPTDSITDQVITGVQPDFSKTSCLNSIAKANSSNTYNYECGEETNGIYSQETSLGTTYYYRGSVNNNWVKFGKMGNQETGGDIWWRIIRINEDGTVRLIYAGTKEEVAKTDTVNNAGGYWMSDSYGINNTGYKFNTSFSYNAYVGYMYGTPGSQSYEKEHGYDLINENNQSKLNSSNAKTQIDAWYETNLADEGSMISGSTGFCGDRSLGTYTGRAGSYTNQGYGTESTYYKAYDRLNYNVANYEPSYECPNSSHDLYTTSSDKGQGNGALENPMGLITADEVVYAGGKSGDPNYGYWLYTGQIYWTLSPSSFGGGSAYMLCVESGGMLYNNYVIATIGLLPVVNLKAEYFKTQDADGNTLDGTIDKPYIASAT